MDRKQFIKSGLMKVGAIVALPAATTSCSKDDDDPDTSGDCELAPSETKGPFPIKTPADLVQENIISDRTGVALLITLTTQDQSNDCEPLAGVLVDVWHCDADGNYSEYGGTQMQSINYTDKHFSGAGKLRMRRVRSPLSAFSPDGIMAVPRTSTLKCGMQTEARYGCHRSPFLKIYATPCTALLHTMGTRIL